MDPNIKPVKNRYLNQYFLTQPGNVGSLWEKEE